MKPYIYAIIVLGILGVVMVVSDFNPLKQLDSAGSLEQLQELVDDGKVEQAQSYALSLIKEQSDSAAQAYSFLGNTALLQGKLAEAEEYYFKAISIESGNADFYSNLGVLYSKKNDPQKALEHFLLAVEVNPDHSTALYNLGNLALARDQKEKAKEYFIKTISADASHSRAHYKLASYYRSTNDTDAAQIAYREAIKANPENIDARIDLGNLLLQLNDLQFAEEQIMAAFELAPNNPRLLYALATLYVEQEKFTAAIEQYQAAIELDGTISSYYVDLAYALIYQGREDAFEKADELLRQAISLSPDDGRTNYLTAVFYDKHQMPGEAVSYYEKAIALKYKASTSMLYAAKSYLKIGNSEAATSLLNQLIDKPDVDSNLLENARELLEGS